MAGLPVPLLIAIWLVGAMWIVGLTARYLGFSSDLVWFVLFLGTSVALAEWRASQNKKDVRSAWPNNHITSTEVSMLSEARRIANTREHLTWSYRFALFWLVLSLVIFGGAFALAGLEEMSEASRMLMFVVLGTIIVISAVWQAVGFTLARLENFIIPRVRGSDGVL